MTATCTEGLIPISMAMLSPKVLPGVDIYLKPSPTSKAVLFCPGDALPDLERLEPLVRQGVNKLFIDRSDRDSYQQYLRDNWEDLLADESQPITNRMAIMSEVMRDVLSEQFDRRVTDDIVWVSKKLGKGSRDLVGDSPILIRHLAKVLHHDYATFTHSTNVSLFCVLLARALGYSPEEQEEIAVGALLHDLGKLQIDDRILTKPGKLDEFEFREIRKHPVTGFEAIAERDDLSFGQVMMAYQHHERLNGSGYPVGCVAEDIHPYAKLCAIADVYEALTAQRPYREPMSPQTALAILDKGDGTEFDSEMLECWRQLILKTQ